MYGAEVLCLQDAEDGNMRKVKYGFKEKILQMGLISLHVFLRNVCVRFCVRMMPNGLRMFGIRKSIKVILSI
mgnify:CR=1 FL=1